MRSTRERQLRLVPGAAAWAAIFSVWVVFFGVDEIDLDAVTPWPKVSGVNRDGRGWATLIVFSLPIIAAIPLRFRDKSAVRASGLWQGIIVPITFIISLFSDTVSIYEVHNNGGWYDFGFVIGAGFFLGGSGAGAKSARRP